MIYRYITMETTTYTDGDLFSNTTPVLLIMTKQEIQMGRGQTQGAVVSSPKPDMTSAEASVSQVRPMMSLDTYTQVSVSLDQVMYAFQVLAIIFNILNIIVLTKSSMRSPATMYSVALSVIQLLYVALTLVTTLNNLARPGPKLNDLFYLVYSIYVGNYVMPSFRRCIYSLRCLLSLERLLAVALPLKAKQFVIVTRPHLFILATSVVVFIANIHVCFKLEVYQMKSDSNSTLYAYRYTAMYKQHPEHFDNASVAMKSIFEYAILLLMLAFSVATIVVLRRHTRLRKAMNTNVNTDAAQKRDIQMTITILVSSALFVLFNLPTASNSVAYNILPTSYGPFSTNRYLFYFLQDFGNDCFVLAFSTDFFTYFTLSSAYRATFFRITKTCAKRDNSLKQNTNTTVATISSSDQ